LLAHFAASALAASWDIFTESAPFVLFGFVAAGLLKVFLPQEAMINHLGKSSTKAVLKASLIGLPLPLCSCGVIPVAVGLRRQGVSKGASAAFLVSTPESGMDSIALSWALLDPVMTVLRPVAAFVTATVTGLLINRLPDENAALYKEEPAAETSCGCGHDHSHHDHGHGESHDRQRPSLAERCKEAVVYAYDELLGDIGRWLLLGIALAGVISALVPASFFANLPGGEWGSLLVMLALGIPMYICASASTPVAAALVLKGVSPGAALVFLLAGPATNAATIAVVARFWGRRAVMIYLASVMGCGVVIGWLTNRLYQTAGLDVSHWSARGGEIAATPVAIGSAIVLIALLILRLFPGLFRRRQGCCGSHSHAEGG